MASDPHPARELLHLARIPASEVAELAGCSQPSASRYLTGTISAPERFRYVCAGILRRPVSELFRDGAGR